MNTRLLFALAIGLNLSACSKDPAEIHASALTLDSHIDIPFDFATDAVDPGAGDLQVNLDKMQAGGLDTGFFIVYVGQDARTSAGYAEALIGAMTKFDAIHRMTEELYPDRIGLAYSADDLVRLIDEGKLAAAIGIENGFVVGRNIELLDSYFELGARYITLVHNGHNDIADSAQPRDELGDGLTEHDGISEFGARVIRRMNELGIMVDISHASKQAALDAIDLSVAPVIASHSSVQALTDHVRNLDDETLRAVAEDDGVVQIVAFESYLGDGEAPAVVDLVDHIDYAVNIMGIEHVGISSDFGGGGGIDGWMDALETPNVTTELLARGYSEEEIGLLWSGNLLRVWRETERVAAEF